MGILVCRRQSQGKYVSYFMYWKDCHLWREYSHSSWFLKEQNPFISVGIQNPAQSNSKLPFLLYVFLISTTPVPGSFFLTSTFSMNNFPT